MQNNQTQIKSDITINELAIEMRNEFKQVNDKLTIGFKDVNNEIEELAGMVAREFKKADANLVVVKEDLENRIDNLEKVIVRNHGTRIRRIEHKLQLT